MHPKSIESVILMLAGTTILYWRREPEIRWNTGEGGRRVMIAALILAAVNG